MKQRLIVFILIFTLAFAAINAQAQETHTVTFDGYSFTFDVAQNVEIKVYPGDPVDFAPGGADAPHTSFTLYNILPDPEMGPAFPFEQIVGSVKFYRLTDLEAYSFLQAEVDELRALLADRPDLMPYTEVRENVMDNALPFVPVYPHGQNFRAQPKYIETDILTGIAYLTAFRADASPLVSTDVTYTVQAISTDGQYYVSISFNPAANVLPTELTGFDPTTYDWVADLTATVELLNTAAASDFAPSLATLDALVASIQIGG